MVSSSRSSKLRPLGRSARPEGTGLAARIRRLMSSGPSTPVIAHPSFLCLFVSAAGEFLSPFGELLFGDVLFAEQVGEFAARTVQPDADRVRRHVEYLGDLCGGEVFPRREPQQLLLV